MKIFRDLLALRQRSKHLASLGLIFFANQNSESCARPGQVIPHTTYAVRLDHGRNTSGFQGAFGELRVRAVGVSVN